MPAADAVIDSRVDLGVPQYRLTTIMLIWAAAALPMAVLGWLVAPAVAPDRAHPGFERVGVLTIGLEWQFVLVMLLLRREIGSLRWPELRARLWLTPPRSPGSGASKAGLWWWLVPVALFTAAFELLARGAVNRLWSSIFPFVAEPAALSLRTALETPEARAQLVGAWGDWTLFIVSALFNTVLGEELLFRGLLLPRMAGVFGRIDWLANGLLFALYHLHQPWGMLGSAITGALCYALPSRYFRCAWFGVIAHSGQSIFLAVLILGLVLGFG
jgi:membrane protease YdiL (CAAX protease family)